MTICPVSETLESSLQREIDRKVIAAAEQAFNIRIESLFNGISNEGTKTSVVSVASIDRRRCLFRTSEPIDSTIIFLLSVPFVSSRYHATSHSQGPFESGQSEYVSTVDANRCNEFYSVYNQVRGFKTRHSTSTGVGVSHSSPTQSATGSTRVPQDFDGYRLSASNSGRYSNDPNQPPLTALVNRVSVFDCARALDSSMIR
jgi:hypothetical protein